MASLNWLDLKNTILNRYDWKNKFLFTKYLCARLAKEREKISIKFIL